MAFSVWPFATTVKRIDDLSHGEIFRFGDNRLGLSFLSRSAAQSRRTSWSHIVHLDDFTSWHYDDADKTSDYVYSLGSTWELLMGGSACACSDLPGSPLGRLLVDRRGVWLIAKDLNNFLCFGLTADVANVRVKLEQVSGLYFKTWSLIARRSPADVAAITKLDFTS